MVYHRAVLRSLFMMLVLTVFFVSATFAWFTDSVSNEGNRIQAGNLKVRLEAASTLDGAYRNISSTSDPIFDFGTNVEPGVEPKVAYLRVTNIGTINMSYRIVFDVIENSLAEAVKFTIERVGHDNTQKTLTGAQLSQEVLQGTGRLQGVSDTFRIEMALDADNTFNVDSQDVQFPLAFEFDLKLQAWQANGPNPFAYERAPLLVWREEGSLL